MSYLFIVNPFAGKRRALNVANTLARELPRATITATQGPKDAVKLAQQATQNVVIAVGGDGTVNEVINGLVHNTNKPSLGIVPLGTANLLAKYLGIETGSARFMNSTTKALDVGMLNNRAFVVAGGVGFDADMFARVRPGIKKLFGQLAYPVSLFETLFLNDLTLLTIQANGNTYQGYYCILCNIPHYGMLQIAKDASIDDGLLDLFVFTRKEIAQQLRYLVGMVTGTHQSFADVIHVKIEQAEINAQQPVLAHADAEVIGTTPIAVRVLKQAINVLV
ncbi:YegS/Rv2252/BmrU family lipid kinase [Candidatus Woesearchaeota archaeon]|nr:YegS/Rv2252/BmrU family lipid kinase [Candidatus Woesearchaeota archaeon]